MVRKYKNVVRNTPNYIVVRETRRTSLGILTGSRVCKNEEKFSEKGGSKLVREFW